jgi:hypothetical protein
MVITPPGMLEDPEWPLNHPLPEAWREPGAEVTVGEAVRHLEANAKLLERSITPSRPEYGGEDTVIFVAPDPAEGRVPTNRDLLVRILQQRQRGHGLVGPLQVGMNIRPDGRWRIVTIHEREAEGAAAP